MNNHSDFTQTLFTDARTYRKFLDIDVTDADIKALYELSKLAPTASNLCPMRVSFARSQAAKDKVIEAVAEGNKAKVQSAPVTAIIAYDGAFTDHMETLAPHMDAASFREQPQSVLDGIAIENTWLYAGFFITAARSLGYGCGPMSGFDKTKIDEAFYAQSSWRSLLLINLGYGDSESLYPRGERLSFAQACEIL